MESRLLGIPLLLVALLVFRFLKRAYLKRKFGAEDAPYIEGTGFFFTRNPKDMLKAKAKGLLLSEVCDQFVGTNGTNRLKIFKPLLSTSDPENIKAILATQFNDFALGTRHSHFMPLLGDGIFTLDGHGWKQSRSMLRPNFSREKVAHTKALEVHLQNLAKHIKKFNGEPFDIQDYFFRFTVDTATEFLFGHSLFGLMDASIGEASPNVFEGSEQFYSAFNKSQEICASRAWLQDFYWLINPKEFKECNKIVHNFAKFYINSALSTPDEEIEKLSQDGYVFLYELVKTTRDPKILQDQLLNIMIAGRDTTAGLLTMTFYELSKNPDVFKRLKEAIYRDFGDNETVQLSDITFESLKKCEFLKHVINETLRLYPNVPLNFRVATKNTTLPRGGGKDGSKPVLVEKGETVGYAIFATHRDPKYYGKDANEFRPDRWTSDLKPGWAFLPFNGGPRICLGQQFALTEASYTIVRLIQMFPNLISEDRCEVYPPTLNSQLTLSLKEGNYIRMY